MLKYHNIIFNKEKFKIYKKNYFNILNIFHFYIFFLLGIGDWGLGIGVLGFGVLGQ